MLSTRYVSGSETMFRGVHKLLPGHLLVFEAGQTRIRQYWDVPQVQDEPDRPESYYVQGYRDLLEQAVGSHLMSDVPLYLRCPAAPVAGAFSRGLTGRDREGRKYARADLRRWGDRRVDRLFP